MVFTVFVLLVVFLLQPTTFDHGVTTDLPKVSHPVWARGAARDDATIVMVTRDGKTFFGSDQVMPEQLGEKLGAVRKDRPLPLYIRADARARYGMVSQVIDAAQVARIPRVVFLVEKRGER